jgi:hypothetical protein
MVRTGNAHAPASLPRLRRLHGEGVLPFPKRPWCRLPGRVHAGTPSPGASHRTCVLLPAAGEPLGLRQGGPPRGGFAQGLPSGAGCAAHALLLRRRRDGGEGCVQDAQGVRSLPQGLAARAQARQEGGHRLGRQQDVCRPARLRSAHAAAHRKHAVPNQRHPQGTRPAGACNVGHRSKDADRSRRRRCCCWYAC